MSKTVILALLLALALGQTTYNYAFSGQTTSTQTVPSYALGTLSTNENIEFAFTVASGTGTLSGFQLQILDANNQPLSPVVTYSGLTGTSASWTWTVVTTGSYRVQVSGSSTNVIMYYLTIKRNGVAYIRIVDVLRTKVTKYFYVANTQNVSITRCW
jgi:hypothetical protein